MCVITQSTMAQSKELIQQHIFSPVKSLDAPAEAANVSPWRRKQTHSITLSEFLHIPCCSQRYSEGTKGDRMLSSTLTHFFHTEKQKDNGGKASVIKGTDSESLESLDIQTLVVCLLLVTQGILGISTNFSLPGLTPFYPNHRNVITCFIEFLQGSRKSCLNVKRGTHYMLSLCWSCLLFFLIILSNNSQKKVLTCSLKIFTGKHAGCGTHL